MKDRTPPKWIDRLLESVIKDRFHDEVIGDLHEWFALKTTYGFTKNIKYLWVALSEIKSYQLRSLLNILIHITDVKMLNNNLKIGFRSLIKQRTFTSINVIGLSTAMCCLLFILSYINHELSVDRYHSKADQIYKVLKVYKNENNRLNSNTQTPLGTMLTTEFGKSLKVARYGNDPVFVQLDEKQFYEGSFYWGDATLFSVFDLPFKYGDASKALLEPNTIVLSEEVSNKYFGEDFDPTGMIIPIKVYDGDKEFAMKVDGVMKALPSNTNLPFEVLGSMSNAMELYQQFSTSWGFNWLRTYVLIPNPDDAIRIENQISKLLETWAPEGFESLGFKFQPLRDVHLYSGNVSGYQVGGNIDYIIIFSIIAAFVIIIATINNINLTTARISKRSSEVGIRKVNGATQSQIFNQFITESAILFLCCSIISVTCTYLFWDFFLDIVNLDIPLSQIMTWQTLGIYVLIFIVTMIIAGGYPAFSLAGLNSIAALTGRYKGNAKASFRRTLVVAQFAISIFMIISTVIIYQQLSYMMSEDLGFNSEHLIAIKAEDKAIQEKLEIMKAEITNIPGVANITTSGESLPSDMNNGWGFSWDADSKARKLGINIVTVDHDFFKTIGSNLMEGSNFSKPYVSDSARSIVINKAAKDFMGLEEVIGMKVEIGGRQREIIGVIEDFHYRSFKEKIQPVAYFVNRPGFRSSPDNILVRLDPSRRMETITAINNIWENFSPNEYFDFHFVDEAYSSKYDGEQRFFRLFGIFSGLSIMISCIGLFGMIVFVTNERSKEISIRKVLGSSVGRIVRLIGQEFTILILIGFLLAVPVSILLLRDWLSQFPYRIEISLWVIVFSGILAVVISWTTIGFNTIKTATSNPVLHLRNE